MCCDSSGNHGQALSWAARQAGVECHVAVPKGAPPVKVAAIKGYNGQVHYCSGSDILKLYISNFDFIAQIVNMFTNGLNITNKTITILEVRLTAKTAKGFFFVFWNIECI